MLLTALVTLVVLFLAFANGANDTFKGVATLHGTGTLSYRNALAWAALTTFAGSAAGLSLSGALVRRFTGAGIVDAATAANPAFLVAAAAGAGATVLLATRFGLPVSTTHALTGGLVGAGAVLAGPGGLAYAALGSTFLLPLLATPVLALLLAAAGEAALRPLRRRFGPLEDTCVCLEPAPRLLLPDGGTMALTTSVALTVDRQHVCDRAGLRAAPGLQPGRALERLHALSAGAVGFARGLNDTPKIAALFVGAGILGASAGLFVTAVGMAVGGLLAARRVARTLSFEITTMDPSQGLAANLVTATLVTLASPLGLPVSTTHVSCGALFGIGAASGEARWKTIRQILGAWAITLPVSATLSALAALAMRLPK